MFTIAAKPDPSTILVIGILLSLFGGLFSFNHKIKLQPLVCMLVLACALPLLTFHYLFDLPLEFRWVLPIAALGTLLILVARSETLTQAISKSASFFKNPAFCGGVLLMLGIAVLGYACYESDPENSNGIDGLVEDQAQEVARDYQPAVGLKAFTDRGNELPLFQLSNSRAEALAKGDQRLVKNQKHQDYLIRVAGPSAQTNCHGWVFTGGLCWISTDGVETILVENGYQQVEVPINGDLVIYRDELGKISHSGIVRGVWSEGRILIESKWGTLGAFIHFVEQSIYPGQWTFHRNQRSSHLLRGLPSLGGASPPAKSKGL